MQNLYKGGQVVTPAGNLEYTYPLFDTFWNNTGLRGTVFVNNSNNEKNEARVEFENFVKDLNSKLYQFVKVK